MKQRTSTLLAVAALTAALAAHAQQPAKKASPQAKAAAPAKSDISKEFEKFREVLEEDNPAELFEAKGEDIWKNKKGPSGASMAQCDLGLGAGVVKGAYVRMPRWFADVGQVMDAERRVVHCMIKYLGYKEEDIRKQPFSNVNKTPDHVSVITYVAAQSRNMKIAAPQKHPKEVETYNIGKEIFAYRAGPYDFSCASCHGADGMRIRTQDLPNLRKPAEAIRAYQGWPGYRMTGGFMLTQQWRMNDCFRQQRFPEPSYLSDSITALLAYMTVTANGQVYKGPGIKR
ncbi:MAG: sulfur oxidation c-type cytochrome SoxA [Rhodocyclaceae bacterium]|jgi:sulfur-oxidizing protein SoxA|nr:sulfur oxidation c-type cytochrome SoxA [Rhodocyclaceae bacterium]